MPLSVATGWVAYSISYWHNFLNLDANWTFPQEATNNSRSFPRLTTSYTSLVLANKDGLKGVGTTGKGFHSYNSRTHIKSSQQRC